MVFEQIFNVKWIERRHVYSFFLGIFFTFIGFITSFIIFRQILGLATIFFTVILAIPSINILFSREEGINASEKKSFFQEYEALFDIFLYFFLGSFLAFLIIGLINISYLYGGKLEGNELLQLEPTRSDFQIPRPDLAFVEESKLSQYINAIKPIIINNIYVMLVSFFLSLFYGAGAIFLIIFNASIFAYGVMTLLRSRELLPHLSTLWYSICNIGIFSFHLLPEVSAYLLAAIAGGILSKAFVREKFLSARFRKFIFDSLKLLFVSIFLVIDAAFIEVVVSNQLFSENACIDYNLLIIALSSAIFIFIVTFELLRHKPKILNIRK
jgi:uncharacterized membrane protein SpoIIM required for sporulation